MPAAIDRLTPDDITGVLGILPTPATPDAGHWSCAMSVDLDETAAMVRRIRRGGIRLLLTGGSFGEGPSLTDAEHVAFAGCVAETLAGDGWLFAGATTLNTRDTIARGRRLIDAGATGLFLGRPMWMALDAPGILRFYRDVAEALPGVPLIVYDNGFAFKGPIPTAVYAELAQIPEIVATKHIGGPALADDLRAAGRAMRVLPVDAQWPALARAHPDLATACWTGNCADGTGPLAALAAAVAARDWARAEHVGGRMAWAQAPMFPGGKLENFVDYNIPIAHGRLQGSGLVRSGPPRPPYTEAPAGHVEGGRETGRRWAALDAEFPAG
jgi:dihydrodipicolinate synthase/N-acetylneuraminate lyase